jgi:hypothetical protein
MFKLYTGPFNTGGIGRGVNCAKDIAEQNIKRKKENMMRLIFIVINLSK